MKRKLVRQGASTLMVSLPSKWVKELNLDKGAEVDIAESEGNLIISAGPAEQRKKDIHTKITGKTESSIRTQVTNLYRLGYDTITAEFETQQQYNIISNVVREHLIGFDVSRKKENVCIIESVSEPSTDQFENMILKIFYSTDELFDVTKRRFGGEKVTENYAEITHRIMKYVSFCNRVISKQRMTNEKISLYWAFLTLFNHGQRELYHVNENLKPGEKVSSGLKYFLLEAEKISLCLKEAYLKKDTSPLNRVHEIEKGTIYTKGHEFLAKTTGKEAYIAYHLLCALREFYLSSSPLLGLIMD